MSRRFSTTILFTISAVTLLWSAFYYSPAQAEITAAIIVEIAGDPITNENGATFFFTIQLDSQPGDKVTILLISDTPSEGVVSVESLEFNQGNWKNPKTIEVTGVPDGIQDGDAVYQITGISSSADPNFNGLLMPAVSITNINDPVPIANDDHPPIDGFAPIVIPVLENDTALDDVPLEISVFSDPVDGSYAINPDPENTITYTPSETFTGNDQFTYMVCDLDGDCASADVVIEDQIPPEIISVSPAGVGGIFEISDEEIKVEVEVTDNFQVNCVNFIRWDARIEQHIQLGEDCQAPYVITIDGNSLNYGWNQISIRASDMAGNISPYTLFWFYRPNYNYIPLIISP
jgi:hypothetical protein